MRTYHSTAFTILSRKTEIIAVVLEWIDKHLAEKEEIDIYEWGGAWFYIVVNSFEMGFKSGKVAQAGGMGQRRTQANVF